MKVIQYLFVALAFAMFVAATPSLGVTLAIDVNSGSSPTATDFTALNTAAGNGNGSSVTDQGVTFTVFSAAGHRDRGGPNDLTRDFIFEDGNGVAAGLRVFDLPNGLWEAEVWSFDNSFPTTVGDQIVGIANFGGGTAVDGVTPVPPGELIFTTSFTPHPTDPFVFRFDTSQVIDGFGIFTRENSSNNRTRFNALRLTQIVPEPTTALLGVMGVAGLAARRRRAA